MKSYFNVRSFILNITGSAIVAFGLFNVHSISQVTEGGTLGLTLFLQYWLDVSPAISSFVLNALCYVFGAIVLGKGFVLYSSVSSIGFSVFYAIFENIGYLFPEIADYPFIASVIGALFVGIGVGLCVRGGGAPCGDDALAMSVSSIIRISIRWVYLTTDIVVLLLSLSYISPQRILFSFITVLLSGQLIGIVSEFPKNRLNKLPR